jgi:hypothetical protein
MKLADETITTSDLVTQQGLGVAMIRHRCSTTPVGRGQDVPVPVGRFYGRSVGDKNEQHQRE